MLCQLPRVRENVRMKTEPNFCGWRSVCGIVLIFVGVLFSVLSNVIVKILGRNNPINLAFWGSLGWLLPNIPIMFYMVCFREDNVFKTLITSSEPYVSGGESRENWWKLPALLLFARIAGLGKIVCQICALTYLSLGDATVIRYSAPIFIILLAHLCLKEPCGMSTVPIGFFITIGVVLFARPGFAAGEVLSRDFLIGMAYAFGGAILHSISAVSIRRLRTVYVGVMSCSGALVGVVGNTILVFSTQSYSVPNKVEDLLLMMTSGLFSTISSILITMALKFLQAGTVALIQMHEVAYSFALQILVFGITPDTYSIVGTAMVMGGVLLITVRQTILG